MPQADQPASEGNLVQNPAVNMIQVQDKKPLKSLKEKHKKKGLI